MFDPSYLLMVSGGELKQLNQINGV